MSVSLEDDLHLFVEKKEKAAANLVEGQVKVNPWKSRPRREGWDLASLNTPLGQSW